MTQIRGESVPPHVLDAVTSARAAIQHAEKRDAMHHNKTRSVARQMRARARWYDALAIASSCEHAAAVLKRTAHELRRLADILMGDLGEEQEEIEILPLVVPELEPIEQPAEPVPA